MFVAGELLRRGVNINEVPVKQMMAYACYFEQYQNMDVPFTMGEQ